MEEQKEDKIIGFDDRNLDDDLNKYEKNFFSKEFIKARKEFVNLYQNQNFELFLKNKNPKLLEEWLKFKKKKKQIKNINYDIPSFLRKEKKK